MNDQTSSKASKECHNLIITNYCPYNVLPAVHLVFTIDAKVVGPRSYADTLLM